MFLNTYLIEVDRGGASGVWSVAVGSWRIRERTLWIHFGDRAAAEVAQQLYTNQ